jgi:hypothetical protein
MNGMIAVERRLAWNRISQERRKAEWIQILDGIKDSISVMEKIKEDLYSRKPLLFAGILLICFALGGALLHRRHAVDPVPSPVPSFGAASYRWSRFHRV